MIPVVSIVGKSESGKTTLIEKLIPELRKHGLRVGTIKHAGHGFQIDQEGKDSWRHQQAGASDVLVVSSTKLALISSFDEEPSVDELTEKFFDNVDLILTEGYKSQNKPKIEVFRSREGSNLLCGQEDNLIAVVSDKELELGVPHFQMSQIPQLALFIIDTFSLPAKTLSPH